MFILLLILINIYIFIYRDFNAQISFPNLQYLILDNNMIESINNFPYFPSCHTLSLSNNNIRDINSFINSARTKFPKLRSVNTLTNPMNPGINNPQGYHQYQNYMKQIPDLLELDWMNIDDNSYMNQGQIHPNLSVIYSVHRVIPLLTLPLIIVICFLR